MGIRGQNEDRLHYSVLKMWRLFLGPLVRSRTWHAVLCTFHLKRYLVHEWRLRIYLVNEGTKKTPVELTLKHVICDGASLNFIICNYKQKMNIRKNDL